MPLAPWESPQVLREALTSLVRQTLAAAQVVISCDGPPTALLQAELESLSLPLTLVIGPGNEGVGPVLARGLQECHHDLVVRADADDVSVPHRCVTMVSWMATHPEVVVLGSVINEFHSCPAQPIAKRSVPIGTERITQESKSRNPLNHPSVILRREVVMDLGNYRSKPGFEDYDLWLRILATCGPSAVANLPESLVLARVGRQHLARRHGYRYALAEGRFFWACGHEGLLDWLHVLKALAVRLPLRLLPPVLLSWVMKQATRQTLE